MNHDIEITQLDLVAGGNVIRQGHHFTLDFTPRGENGDVIALTGKDLYAVFYDKNGIRYEGAASYISSDAVIRVEVTENIGHGTMWIEFTATDPNDAAYKKKFPARENNARISITPSTDDLSFVGVKSITVEQLRNEQAVAQQEFEADVLPRVETVESQQAQLAADYQAAVGALTEDSEVILARGDKPTLGARLDDTAGKLAEKLDKKFGKQKDFVNFVSRMSDYDSMYYKRENTLGWITVTLIKGLEHISWAFRNNTYDDFIILGDCFYGSITKSLKAYQNENYENITGTGWITSAANAHYTTVVGDTMTNYIEGEKIEFHHYADNRGGIWEFIINDDTDNPITVSTWSSTAVATNDKLLVEGLPYGTHKVVGTFKGDDPANVPSGGAGTARGWVYVNGSNNYLTYRSFKTQLTNNREKDLMVGFSNKEFAFNMRKAGLGTYQFVPYHSGVGTAFEQAPERTIADGRAIDIMGLEVGDFVECSEFRLAQNVYARNPDSGAENLALISTNVTITKKGLVEILGKMTVLADIEISDGYGIMFPASKPMIDRVQTSIGNQYAATKTDGTRTSMTDEVDATAGFLFTSATEKDFALAARYNEVEESLRTDKTDKYAKGNTAWLEHRDANMTKLYQSVYYNALVPTGSVYKWGGTFAVAKVASVNDVV